MYPSDYGYATSGGNTTDRKTCLANPLYKWNDTSYVSEDCYTNDWLYKNLYQWTLTPSSSSNHLVFFANNFGYISTNNSYALDSSIFPSTYLSSNVKIISGTGAKENPYELSL